MGIKWVMLIQLSAWFQSHSKNSNVLYSVTNVIIIITLSKNCGDIKNYLERIYNVLDKTGLKLVDFLVIYDDTIWAKFLVLCELLILDWERQAVA